MILENCSFSGNYAYNQGNDVLNVDDGIVYYNGIKVTTGYYGPIAYTQDVLPMVVNIIATIAFIVAGLVGIIGSILVGAIFSPVAGIALGAACLATIVAVFYVLTKANQIDGVDTSKYENYSPELIDIDKYNMNYESEVIDAVSF